MTTVDATPPAPQVVVGARSGRATSAPAIETVGLTKWFGRTLALDHLDLRVERGEVLGYLGPNGAGKSTTIQLLLGLIRPTAGSARIFGRDAWGDAAAAHRRLASVPNDVSLWPALTGQQVLDLLAHLHGDSDRRYRADLLERFRLDPTVRMRAASHGNRQKVLLVAAFASRAELLLLDEPTTGLDPLMAQVFRECVREAKQRGQTVLLSSHVLAEVEAVCDRVSMLRAGRLLEIGSLDRLRAMASVHVRIVVAGAVPDLRQIAGVQRLHVDGHVVECDLTGSMAPLLSALAGCTVLELRTHEPSLEELFLAEYGADRP